MPGAEPLPLRAYGLAARLALPLAGPWLRRRVRLGLEDAGRIGERLGHASLPPPEARPVWLHAASLGETRAMLPLVAAIRGRGRAVLATTATLTANRLARERLAGEAAVQLAPLDLPQALERFLGHWRPSAALLVESEIWPCRLAALAERGVPALVVNGRISAESARRWARVPGTAGAVFGRLALVLAQGEADAGRYRALGAPRVETVGNLKRSALPLPCDAGELRRLRAAVAGRRVWVAASTHPGEEPAIAEAHRRAAAAFPDLLTIVAPRHPDRAEAAARAFAECGLAVARRSAQRQPDRATAVFMGDTLGELGLWYRLGELAFVGASLVPRGGHNPIEPAMLGRPVLIGPHHHHVAELALPLLAAGGAVQVADGGALAGAVAGLLADPGRRGDMAARAQAVADEGRGVLDTVMRRLSPWLDHA
ncbi:MAG TPA: glycosyltransferase N-terminal domain-containing protein [Geminicoccaceae bacterium]|nr:glycosyltransferase N-terminal domain-containing protein [Geminicoccus sp.]HMU49178.1 glycosyltransferase N-terminal domain-containing protein [Geminicoccaceae bacterium]